MSSFEKSIEAHYQAKLFEFALLDLVRRSRDSFQPLWTSDSWAKFLIWLALNCGLSGDRESLEEFARAIGSPLHLRMRKIFFERTFDDVSLHLMADPAESMVLFMPLEDSQMVSTELVQKVLAQMELSARVNMDKSSWQELDALVAIPWLPKSKHN